MDANTRTLKELFQKDVRYVIPTFQRPYVWDQDGQWEALWDDLRNVAERYLDELDAADGNSAIAEEEARSHFMGAVVLQQTLMPTAEIETRTVIDGQQRLTTMQLVLDAAQEVMEELEFPEASRLARLVENVFSPGDERFKLWPTGLDQAAFRASMTNSAVTPEGFEDSLIVQAHDFFRLQIKEWVESAADDETKRKRAHGLETALFALLELVVIDLTTADDPFVIFETLNARGTPLLDSDLVKNYILQTASGLGFSSDDLYEQEWRPLEDIWWRTEVQQGRIVRPRLDVFLNYWLMMRKSAEVTSTEVFREFKSFVEKGDSSIQDVARDLRAVGETYRAFDDFEPYSAPEIFVHRWRVIEAGVTTPLLLWLFSQLPDQLEASRRDRCLIALESFLVRRMVCRMTTKNYNDLFLELLSQLSKSGPELADEVLVSYLSGQTADSRLWPDDTAFEFAILDMPLYRLLTRGRLRMLLEALEDAARSSLADEKHVARGALTIEHVLPQKWHAHWPLADGDIEAVGHRERVLHSLGNLTLVNDKLNPTLSNAAWPAKQKLLSEHAVLHLNKELFNGYATREWNETTIRERGKVLAERAKSVWPAPLL
ncbi:MAG: DUF262 domain-containing HNH endonuclease family protein [Actinomycetota bacterium]|nr:DUF262 domain-containing HNH endonuclease family protein [Actinomycetota bacterium]